MILKNTTIITEDLSVKENVDVIIQEDKISKIVEGTGKGDDAPNADGEIIDCSNYIVMPGFFNAHGHSPMSLMRGYGENLTLQDWLYNKIFPFEAKLTSEAVYYGNLLSMAESLKYGIISTSDMYYFLDDMVQAVLDSGCKANISRAVANPTGEPFDELIAIKETKDAVAKHQGVGDGRVIIEGSLHAEYTSNEDTATKLAQLSKELGIRMHVHVSETQLEHEECKERHEGRTPTEYLADCGIFDIPALAAHCVWVSEKDMDILKKYNVSVVTNPASNMKLGNGFAPVPEMLEKGINVCIGTDGAASNNSLNLIHEMSLVTLIHKGTHQNPQCVSATDAFRFATIGGARGLGLDKEIGSIEVGKKADLAIFTLKTPSMWPVNSPLSALAYSANGTEAETVLVDGKILMEQGKVLTMDEERIYKETEDIMKRIGNR